MTSCRSRNIGEHKFLSDYMRNGSTVERRKKCSSTNWKIKKDREKVFKRLGVCTWKKKSISRFPFHFSSSPFHVHLLEYKISSFFTRWYTRCFQYTLKYLQQWSNFCTIFSVMKNVGYFYRIDSRSYINKKFTYTASFVNLRISLCLLQIWESSTNCSKI